MARLLVSSSGHTVTSEPFCHCSMYSRQKDPLLDRLLHTGRLRFGGAIYPRQAGIRKILRAVQAGEAFYYLPDMRSRRFSSY